MVFWTILKYHSRYYCQIPLQVMLLHGETASIWVRLPLWCEICGTLRFKMVNLARSLALACAMTSHHICFSSLKRSRISLYSISPLDRFPINALSRFTDFELISFFLRSSTSSWTEIYISPWRKEQNSRYFLTRIRYLWSVMTSAWRNLNENRSVQNTDCGLRTGYKIWTRV